MSAFWSTWVIVLAVITLGIATFLFLWALRVKIPQEPDGTTGHVWAHGVLREAVRPLPKWWVLVSIVVFAVGFGYLYRYPGLGHYGGSLGWTSAGEVAKDTAANDKLRAPLAQRIASGTIAQLAADPDARRQGERLFMDNCSACHGSDGHGNPLLGAPNLADGDWLYGGDDAAILTSILDGRHGTMPPFTPALDDVASTDMAHYVLSLSGAEHDAAKAKRGGAQFGLCAACHAEAGTGNITLGAPNLADGTWLYGGDVETIARTISHGRSGVMPAWRGKLAESDAKLAVASVYGRTRGQSGGD